MAGGSFEVGKNHKFCSFYFILEATLREAIKNKIRSNKFKIYKIIINLVNQYSNKDLCNFISIQGLLLETSVFLAAFALGKRGYFPLQWQYSVYLLRCKINLCRTKWAWFLGILFMIFLNRPKH